MTLRTLVVVILGLSLSVSCFETQDAKPVFPAKAGQPQVEFASMDESIPVAAESSVALEPSPFLNRKLIRNATFEIEVEGVTDASREATFVAERNGGVLADSRFFRNAEGEQSCTLRLRVPSERFGAVCR